MTARIGRFPGRLLVASLALAGLVWGVGGAGAAEAPVDFGSAASYAVLGASTVTNTGPSVISGDVGVSPLTAVTGFPPGTVVNGTIHAADAEAARAQDAATTAYNDAAGRSPSATVTADLGGQTLVAGVYNGPTLAITGTLTLDAQGDPDAVFVFQADSSLVTAAASRVVIVGGGSACNVVWKVGSSATLGTNSVFVGNVLALASVTATTGASVTGRLVARSAAVTLDTNSVTAPVCAAVVSTTTSTTTAPPTATTVPDETSTTGPPATSVVPAVTSTTARPGITGTTGSGTVRSTTTTTRSTGTAIARTGSGATPAALGGLAAVVLGGLLLAMSSRRPSGWRADRG